MEKNIKLNIRKLTKSISAENAVGYNLNADASSQSTYYQLKDRWEQAKKAEKRFSQQQDAEALVQAKQLWRELEADLLEVLYNESKSLEVAAWLLDTLLRNHGLIGLTKGFTIIAKLVERFWPDIYPLAEHDDDDISDRLFMLTGLNGRDEEGSLMPPLQNIIITQSSEGDEHTYGQYLSTLASENIADVDRKARWEEAGGIALSEFEKAIATTPDAFYQDLLKNIADCLASYKNYVAVIEKHCELDHFPSSNIKNALEKVQDTIMIVTNSSLETEIQDETAVGLDSDTVEPQSTAIAEASIAINYSSRDAVFKQLLQAAAYFRQHEPQSLVPYMLERTVSFGRMSAEQLMQELVGDSDSKSKLMQLTGIQT